MTVALQVEHDPSACPGPVRGLVKTVRPRADTGLGPEYDVEPSIAD